MRTGPYIKNVKTEKTMTVLRYDRYVFKLSYVSVTSQPPPPPQAQTPIINPLLSPAQGEGKSPARINANQHFWQR